ncbi:hypothetical protein JCGZ_04555 [Jatropha curcas]|uniref:Uncharacterized protein n=1 Tax=Jatropha curcas TaxID=180498 RepID=A0A067LDQ9_JATCU|nr:hypothetical protein JCGZ_04555 [Jatropha curcas]
MPFKQKAKKNKEGSSSSAPARRDLASRYKAPFPIYTIEEGERFTRLAKCNFTGMYLLDQNFLQNTGILEKVQEYLKTLNFEIFSQLKIPENAKLSLELLSTIDWVDDTEMAIKFRVDGEDLTVDYDKMHQWLGFPRNGFASKPKGWNATSIWEIFTCQSSFAPRNAGNKWIKDESIVLDKIYNASRHQGKVTLGVGSMASILTYAARMPIPPYQPQPTVIFRYMDGAFLKKTGLVEEVKTGTTVMYRWKPWERRVGQSDRDEGTSDAQLQRQRKGKAPVTSSSHAAEEEDEVAGWKQVLSKVEALQQSPETLQVTVFDMGQQLHTIQKNHERMERKWMKYFHKQNIKFTPSPPGSPEAQGFSVPL